MTSCKETLSDLENTFLTSLCEQKSAVTLFLVNGVKLQGVITRFDKETVLLRREAHEQLVYKHAVSTIMPHTQVHLDDEDLLEDQHL